jgi:hypothetical protein
VDVIVDTACGLAFASRDNGCWLSAIGRAIGKP